MNNPQRNSDPVEPPQRTPGPKTNPRRETGGLRDVTIAPGTNRGATRPDLPRADRPPGVRPHLRGRRSLSSEEVLDPYVGVTIDGRYHVERKLGEGGMGVVYQCRHAIIDKQVAIKILKSDLTRNDEVAERFVNEARSASSIGNPHIIDISDFGRLPDGAAYFVMEFLTGTSLADLVDAGEPLEPLRAGRIALQLTEALFAAHQTGIIHRDLKPDNIFLIKRGAQDDFVKILDFGIAKASSAQIKLTQAGQVFGTPHYMSPEQSAGTEVDHRSDIYAMGVILYELICGRLPFDADNFMAILTQHMYKAPTPPSAYEDLPYELPAGLETIILTCLAKRAEDRYQSMLDLGSELARVFAGELPLGVPGDGHAFTDSSPEAFFARISNLGPAPSSSRRPKAPSSPGRVPLSSRSALYSQRDSEPEFARLARTRNRRLLSALGGIVVFVGGLLTWLSTSEGPTTTASSTAKLREIDLAPPSAPAPGDKESMLVAVAVTPLSAHVFRGDEDLGRSPLVVDVGKTPITLQARHPKYPTIEFAVDGSTSKLHIDLQASKQQRKLPKAVHTARPAQEGALVQVTPQHSAAAPTQPDDGLVDPWASKRAPR